MLTLNFFIETYEIRQLLLLNAKTTFKCIVFCDIDEVVSEFIGKYTVVTKKGLAYTLNLPR